MDVSRGPCTREVLLEGLRQALQTRVVNIWTSVTLRGEPDPQKRFTEGIRDAIEFYEWSWKHIDEVTR